MILYNSLGQTKQEFVPFSKDVKVLVLILSNLAIFPLDSLFSIRKALMFSQKIAISSSFFILLSFRFDIT